MAKPTRCSQPEHIKANSRTFFVTTRAAEGKALLQTDRMAGLFVDVLRSHMLTRTFQVHDFVVMRNHVHLLITVRGKMTIRHDKRIIALKIAPPVSARSPFARAPRNPEGKSREHRSWIPLH